MKTQISILRLFLIAFVSFLMSNCSSDDSVDDSGSNSSENSYMFTVQMDGNIENLQLFVTLGVNNLRETTDGLDEEATVVYNFHERETGVLYVFETANSPFLSFNYSAGYLEDEGAASYEIKIYKNGELENEINESFDQADGVFEVTTISI